jgi:Holliday junction resolvase RusA-like endonuclease
VTIELGALGPALLIRVVGTPAPQGSKVAFVNKKTGRAQMVESSKDRVSMWRQDVIAAAAKVMDETGWVMLAGPVEIDIAFTLRRPKAHYRTGRYADLLRPNAPLFPLTKPDLDKTLRATLDALTIAGVWKDDALVSSLSASKDFCNGGAQPGASIFVTERTG